MKTNRLFIKSLSMFLAILITILVVPLSVYAEIFDVPQAEVSEDASSGKLVKPEVYELVDRREENVKHFKLSDGTVTAVMYETPVHYLDGDGEWQDIDNTLASDGSEYTTSNARVKFAKKTTGNGVLFTLHENNTKITMSLDGANKKVSGQVTNTVTKHGEEATELQKQMTLDKLSSRILYPDILDGVDLEYVVKSGNIKENIIVKEKLDSYSFSFTVSLNNLTAILNDDGSVSLINSLNETVYMIPSGYMYDANCEYSEAVTYTLSNLGNGKYTLCVTADATWINNADRAFPVTIDPPIVSDESSVTDLYISSTSPSTSYASGTYLYLGSGFRTYLKLNALPTLPSNAYLTSAYVSMKCVSGHGYPVGAYQVMTDWGTTLTWNGLSSAGEKSTSVLDYADLDLTANGRNYRYSWDITTLVKEWYNGFSPNYGVCFAVVDGAVADGSALFYSTESTTAGSTPCFTINYRDMKGLESYWTQISQNVGLAGAGSVNVANGSLTFVQGTVSTIDSLFEFTPAFVYNSSLAGKAYTSTNAQIPQASSYMPNGFKLNINETVVKKTYTNANGENVAYYIWADSDGTEHAFMPVTGNTYQYVDEDGLLLKMEVTSVACTITDDSHVARNFTKTTSSAYSEAWYLTSIKDASGNTLNFTFNSSGAPTAVSVTPVSGTAIEQLRIAYNSGGKPSVIWRHMAGGDAMIFRYSSTPTGTVSTTASQYLREVVYVTNTGTSVLGDTVWQNYYNGTANSNIVKNATVYYTYDSSGRLISAKDGESGYEVKYTYSSNAISAAQEYGNSTAGQKLSFIYYSGYTVVRSAGSDDTHGTTDDIWTYYMFDREGRVVSSYSANTSKTDIYGVANGEYATENEKAKNSLKVSAHSNGSNSANYLLNGGFENGLTYWTTSNASVVQAASDRESLNNHQVYLSVGASGTAYLTQYVFLYQGSYSLSMDVLSSIPKNVTLTISAQSLSNESNVISAVVRNNSELGKFYAFLDLTANNVSSNGEIFAINILARSNSAASNTAIILDNIMLAKATGAQNYNMVKNGSFENTAVNASGIAIYTPASFWTMSSDSASSTIETWNPAAPFRNSLQLQSGIGNKMSAEQVIYTSPYTSLSSAMFNELRSTAPYVLTVSGFGRATSVLPNEKSKFAIRLEVTYFTDGGDPVTEEKYFNFSKETDAWQYVSGSLIVPIGNVIKELKICCEYTNNTGAAYFDDISVQYDIGGTVNQSYYREDGRLGVEIVGSKAVVYDYYPDGDVLLACNENGITYYSYDTLGRLICEEYDTYSGAFEYGVLITEDGYASTDFDVFGTNLGDITKKYTNEYFYNVYGLHTGTAFKSYVSDVVTETLTSSTTYNLGTSKHFGSVATETDTLGKTTQYFYEAGSGRLKAIINPEGSSGTVYGYDDFGRLDTVQPATYSGGTPSAQTNAESVDYTYSNGHLTAITTDSVKYTLGYDGFGNNTSIKAGIFKLANYTYNANNGKLSTITYGNGFKVSYTYDALDRIETVLYNGTVVHRYNYDSAGNINKFEDLANGKTYVYKYDLKNQLTHVYEQTTSGDTISSSLIFYDEKSRPEYLYYDIAYAVGSASAVLETVYINEYNEDGNVDKYRVESGSTKYHFDPEYDSMDRVKKRTVNLIASAGTLTHTVEYGFTANGTNTSLQVSDYVSKISGVIVNQYQYVYDNNGNITQIKNGSGVIQNQYAYDDLGQLVREDNRVLNKSYTYSYDNAGNITSRKTYAFTTGTLGTATKTESYTYGNASWGDLVTSINGYSITYDAVGNPLTYYTGGLDSVLTWTNGRQLASYENMDGLRTYTYNDEGIRISRTVSGVEHKYQLNGTQIVSETWGNHTIFYIYDENGSIAGMRYRTSSYAEGVFDEYLFEKNLQGDVVAIYNVSGTKLVSYTYDAWGKVTTTYSNSGASTSARYNPFRYRGYYYDDDTGFYYLNSRYYDPSIGRFINADVAIGQFSNIRGANMFAYCFNNPMNMSDSIGSWPKLSTILAVVGVAAVAVAVVAAVVVTCGAAAPAIAIAGGGISAGTLTTAAAVGGAAVTVAKVATAASVASYVAEKAIEKTTERNNSVYVLRDDAGTVQYVGRTNNVEKRRIAHGANPSRAGLKMEVIASGLTLPEARALEQSGMAYYHTINTSNKMNNQINSVSPKYWGPFKELALGVLDYGWNQMSNEILYWIGS